MKKTGKLLSLLLVMVMVITSIPALVLADDDGQGPIWSYVYTRDDTLKINWNMSIIARNIIQMTEIYDAHEEYVTNAKSVIVDFSKAQPDSKGNIDAGLDCAGRRTNKDCTITIRSGGEKRYTWFWLSNSHLSGDKIIFEEGASVKEFILKDFYDLQTMDFIKDCKAESLEISSCYGLNSNFVIDSSYLKELTMEYCHGLKTLDLSKSGVKKLCVTRCEDITKIFLPDGLEELENCGCVNLKSVFIPASVTKISDEAFSGCDSLKTLFFGGTAEQWEEIYNGSEDLDDVMIIYNAKPGWYEIMNEGWAYITDEYSFAEGWTKINGYWYYFTPDALMNNDWQIIDGTWYYFGTNGIMKTGWQLVDGKWYYLAGNGAMRTGWIPDGGKWYYCDNNGAMVTGWKQVNGVWYFFKSNGEMAANEYCNGYWLSASGAWTYQYVAKWTEDSKGWWFGDTSGWYAKNESYTINGKVYNFDANGYCTNP